MTNLTNHIRRYTSLAATIDILHRKQLPLLDPQSWDDRNDRYFMGLYKERKKLGGLYGLCAAAHSETYHHWRIFTSSSDGACIEIKRKPLETLLAGLDGVRFGLVEYLLLDDIEKMTPSDQDRMPFLKRSGFQAEAEYRIVAESSEAQQAAMSIAFPLTLINKIYLNPWMPTPLAESVKSTLRKIPGCDSLAVSHSRLIENSRWKSAGDKIADRPSATGVKLVKSKVPKNAKPS